MIKNRRSGGFMTQQAHMLGAALMPIIFFLIAPLLFRWLDSPLLVAVAILLLFVPVFVVSHGIADVLMELKDDLFPGDSEEITDEDQTPTGQDPIGDRDEW